MEFETRIFNNNSPAMVDRFPKELRDAFFINSKAILDVWHQHLQEYARRTGDMFGKPELPWVKFDEQTWVSSLAIAIAREFPNSLVIEELPVLKGDSSNGNADLWCCLDAGRKGDSFNFYLEAKVSSKMKRDIRDEKLPAISWENAGKGITQNKEKNQDSHFSRVIRDYLKSTGTEIISSRSPHANETGRKHKHASLALILLPVLWKEEEWPAEIKFESVFENKLDVLTKRMLTDNSAPQSTIRRHLYNIPSTSIVMRETVNRTGFIALMMMLGGSDQKGARLVSGEYE